MDTKSSMSSCSLSFSFVLLMTIICLPCSLTRASTKEKPKRVRRSLCSTIKTSQSLLLSRSYNFVRSSLSPDAHSLMFLEMVNPLATAKSYKRCDWDSKLLVFSEDETLERGPKGNELLQNTFIIASSGGKVR